MPVTKPESEDAELEPSRDGAGTASAAEQPGARQPDAEPAAEKRAEPSTGAQPASGAGAGPTHSPVEPEPEPRSGSTAPEAEATGPEQPSRLSRRGVLGLVGAGAAGLAVGAVGGGFAGAAIATGGFGGAGAGHGLEQHPFFGIHQAGITTPTQDRLHFASFDVREGTTRQQLLTLLQKWSYAASRLTQGLDISASGAVGGSSLAPPDDTGEALGLPPAGLTITIGFGPTLFVDANGADRFGLADRRPPLLEPLPRFTGDALEAAISGGDLCVQACANDPQVAVHAIRNFTRIGFGTVVLRWSQLGFGRTSSTSTTQQTARNLFGFKDGTANIKAEETAETDAQVWVGASDGPDWMAGGSYLVARKIRMVIESWDRQQLGEQERVFGRDKREGAPLSGGGEFTDPDFSAVGPAGAHNAGKPVIDLKAHVRLAHPTNNGGARILRRGYNFVDGNDQLGRLDAGLFFLSYQRDPNQFVTVQRSLSGDLLNEYIRHVGSGVWAIPPGARENGYVGETLIS